MCVVFVDVDNGDDNDIVTHAGGLFLLLLMMRMVMMMIWVGVARASGTSVTLWRANFAAAVRSTCTALH